MIVVSFLLDLDLSAFRRVEHVVCCCCDPTLNLCGEGFLQFVIVGGSATVGSRFLRHSTYLSVFSTGRVFPIGVASK